MSRRYPLEPLCEALACSPDALKARLGLDRRQIAAYQSRGLSEARADELAVKAGLPTHLVWPEMIDHAIMEISRECDECGTGFVRTKPWSRFCSPLCGDRQRKRERNRRLYREDPEWAEAQRARARAYYVECREYVRNRQNRQRQSDRAKNKDNGEFSLTGDGKKTGANPQESCGLAPFSPQSPQVRRETVAA